MPLPGIRLEDLYSSNDYNTWLKDSTNVALIRGELEKHRRTDPDVIKGHFYMNSKIKEAIGEEGFSQLPGNMRLQEKIDWYNKNVAQAEGSSNMEEPEALQPQLEQRDTLSQQLQQFEEDASQNSPEFTLPTKNFWTGKNKVGTTLREWFKDNAGGDYTGYLEAEAKKRQQREEQRKQEEMANLPEGFEFSPLFNAGAYKSEETRRLEDELNIIRDVDPNDTIQINAKKAEIKKSREADSNELQQAFGELYREEALRNDLSQGSNYYAPIDRDLWNTDSTSDRVDELTNNLRNRLDSDPTEAFDLFKNFEDEMMKYVPQYRNYHDSFAMPFTPEEMKDIMAEYYSIRQLKDENEAINFVSSVFQKRLSDSQTLFDSIPFAMSSNGANIAGNTIAFIGGLANALPAAYDAFLNEGADIDDVNGWKEWLYYALDNPLSKWGNRMVTTGVWNPEMQEEFERDERKYRQVQKRPGQSISLSDIYEQMGFTVAGMYTGGTTAQILKNTIGRGSTALATKMLAREGAGWATRASAWSINTLGKELVTVGAAYLPAAAEASMDAMDTYNTSKQQAEEAILMGMKDQLEREYSDGTYDAWYQQNSRLPSMLANTPVSPEEFAQLQQREKEYLWNTYQTLRQQEVLRNPEVQKTIEEAAHRAAARNMFDETMWIALGDYTISNALGKTFKAVKQGGRRALLGTPETKFKWVPDDAGHLRPVAQKPGFMDYVKAVGRGTTEAVSEGVEELFQTVDSKMRQDLNKNLIAQYIHNRYDPDSTAAISDSLNKNWEIASASMNETLHSEEALNSFILGSVSALLGSPTGARGVRAFTSAKAEGKSFWKSAWEGMKAGVRNPIAENINEVRADYKRQQQEAADVRRWMDANPNIETLDSEAAIISFVNQQEKAVRDGDEVSYRDAVMGQKVATMLMLERANPDGAKHNFYARLRELSKLSPADAQARNVLDQVLNLRGETSIPRTTEGALNEQEAEVIKDVADKAKELLNTHKNLMSEISVLDSEFGDSISRETKEALAYSLIMRKDWDNRVAKITDKAIKAFNEANPDSQVTPIAEDQRAAKNALAKYGSKEKIEAEYKQLMKERASLRAKRGSMYKYQYKAAFDRNQKALKENRDAARALNQLEEGAVITAEEILSLGSRERAYLLDEANRKNYSEAQQREISLFVTSEGIRGDMVTDLVDAGRLQNKMDYFKDQFDGLMKNNGALIPAFEREVKLEASRNWVKAKLASALDANTYEEFKDAMDRTLATEEFTDFDRMAIGDVINQDNVSKETWDFFEKYKREEMTRRSIRGIIENSPEFKNLKEEEKEVVQKAVEQVQREGGEVTAKSIIDKLVDPNYLQKLETEGIDTTALRESMEELANAVEKVMKQKESYDRNYKTLKDAADGKRIKKKDTDDEGKPLPKTGETPKPEGKSKTIIPVSRYEQNKEKNDNIFKKIVNNLTRRKQQKLNADEYVSFFNLYFEDPIVGGLVTDTFDTSLTESGIQNAINQLNKAVENKLYTDEKASESEEVRNTLKLVASLTELLDNMHKGRFVGANTTATEFFKNSIIQLNPSFEDAFKKKEIKLSADSIKNVDSKNEKGLTSQVEKEWYEKNHISENLETLMGLPISTVDLVFIKDEELERKLREEKGEELDDDDIPLIMAARVPLKTKGAQRGEGGYNYLYVGLLKDSRMIPEAEPRNGYNALRRIAADQEGYGVVRDKGQPIVTKRLAPKRASTTTDKTETTSFRDFLFDKYKHITNEKERKKAVIDDFIKHYRRIKLVTKDGETKGAYDWPGKDGPVSVSWSTTSPDGEGTRGAYIQEDADGTLTPLFLEVRGIDEVDFDDEHTMFAALDAEDIDITDSKYEKNEGNYVRKSVNAISTILFDKRDRLISSRLRATLLPELNGTSTKSGTLQASIEKYLNLAKPAGVTKGNVSIGVRVEDDQLKLVCWETGEDETLQAYDIPPVLSSIPMSDLKDPATAKKSLNRLAQEGIKNLIFNEDGTIRKAQTKTTSDTLWPIIKFEDKQTKNDETIKRVFDRQDITLKLLGNIWQVRKYAYKTAPDSVSVEPVAPVTKQTAVPAASGNPQQTALKKLNEFIDEHEGEHFETGPNEMEVTTFIKGGEEDVNWGDESLAGKLATNLGTSVDKLYRVWRQLSDDVKAGNDFAVANAIIDYMNKRGSKHWPGLSTTEGIPKMIEQFRRIDAFFESRGEVQFNADLIFRGVVQSGNQYKELIGKPDIITVDKEGRYHIYDIKSFRYKQGIIGRAPGMKSTAFTLNGKDRLEQDMEKWRKQMSMYKALLESKFGPNSVSTHFGVIPIRLGYQVTGNTVDSFVMPGIGAHRVFDREGKALHLAFTPETSEVSPSGGPEPITRCYDDVIHLTSIDKLEDINPEGWRMIAKADEYKMELEKAKQSGKTGPKLESDEEDLLKDVEFTVPPPAEVTPEIKGTVEIHKPLNERSNDELRQEVRGEVFSEDLEEQLLGEGGCGLFGV